MASAEFCWSTSTALCCGELLDDLVLPVSDDKLNKLRGFSFPGFADEREPRPFGGGGGGKEAVQPALGDSLGMIMDTGRDDEKRCPEAISGETVVAVLGAVLYCDGCVPGDAVSAGEMVAFVDASEA